MSRWLLVGLAALAAGCAAAGEDEREAPHVVDVEIGRYSFEPGTSAALEVPRGREIVLRLTSVDVAHGFSILEYNIHAQVPPGAVVEVRFFADKPGAFTIFCTVFCGAEHPQHKGTLLVA